MDRSSGERLRRCLDALELSCNSLKFPLFNPTAEITGQEGAYAVLNVQGAALTPASPAGAVVSKGTVFLPLRLVSLANGKVQILRIPYTYLQAESVEGSVARCKIVSAMSDPLTKRVLRPNSLAALGLKAGSSPIQLRFVTKPNQAPAAGYTLTARLVPDGQPRQLGTTDRAGRIVLRPGFADGLVILRLLAGNVEPVVYLPMMPCVSYQDKDIAIDPKEPNCRPRIPGSTRCAMKSLIWSRCAPGWRPG